MRLIFQGAFPRNEIQPDIPTNNFGLLLEWVYYLMGYNTKWYWSEFQWRAKEIELRFWRNQKAKDIHLLAGTFF